MLVVEDKLEWAQKSGQGDCADESSRNRSREGKMIIIGFEELCDFLPRYSMGQYIMNSLYVEGFLDLGIGGHKMMDLDQDAEKVGQRYICLTCQIPVLLK